jgi:hypothetical protein
LAMKVTHRYFANKGQIDATCTEGTSAFSPYM